jgi:hypothetical protein
MILRFSSSQFKDIFLLSKLNFRKAGILLPEAKPSNSDMADLNQVVITKQI